MGWFIAIILIAIALGIALVVLQQQGKLPGTSSSGQPPSRERNVFNLQVGDIVQHMAIDWVVEGKLIYDEDGYVWYEYLLQDGERISWLSVDEDNIVEVALVEPTNQLEISSLPPANPLTYNGETYRQVDSGTAKMRRVGATLRRTAERCDYYDYEGSGNKVLAIEVWGRDLEVTIGEKVNPRSLTLLPGSGERVYGS
jgi:hypothetical protein